MVNWSDQINGWKRPYALSPIKNKGTGPCTCQSPNLHTITGHQTLQGSPCSSYSWDLIHVLIGFMPHVTVSPSPQPKEDENEKLHKLRRYARDFRRQHMTDAERFNWDSDDEDYGLAIGRLVVT
jgi:hypothetical protein